MNTPPVKAGGFTSVSRVRSKRQQGQIRVSANISQNWDLTPVSLKNLDTTDRAKPPTEQCKPAPISSAHSLKCIRPLYWIKHFFIEIIRVSEHISRDCKLNCVVVYLAIDAAAKKWSMPIRNCKAALNRFMIDFPERMPETL